MLRVVPDYYKSFKCITSKCRHNCCIGWEIDIDEKALSYYKNSNGLLKERFTTSIEENPTPHFVLGENERCPFLNNENLCDIIINEGEERLCTICTEHPRFHNELPGRIESGLGLVCEEAARLIITKKTPVTFEITGDDEGISDEIVSLRDEIAGLLQDREKPLEKRFENAFSLLNAEPALPSQGSFIKLLMSLERLDENWTKILQFLQKKLKEEKSESFSKLIANRLTEYEQFSVYLIYRHMANSVDPSECVAVLRFAAMFTDFFYLLGQAIFEKEGDFSVDTQLELMRIFSGEIEYSDENLQIILEALS